MSAHIQTTGVFERLVWQSKRDPDKPDDIPFVIGKLEDGRTIKGNADPAEFMQGVEYRLQGTESYDSKYKNKVFAFKSFVMEKPHSRRGLTIYLQRNCEGIGTRRASDLFDAFGADAVKVLRNEPDRAFAALKGSLSMDKIRAASAKLKSMLKTEHVRIELIDLLGGRGFRTEAIRECIATWKLAAPEIIKQCPYALIQKRIPGAGFMRCDQLYLDLGHDEGAIVRQVYAMQHALKSDTTGHTWHQWREVLAKLNQMMTSVEVDGRKAMAEALSMGLIAERKDGGQLWIAEAKHAANEVGLAACVRELCCSQKQMAL